MKHRFACLLAATSLVGLLSAQQTLVVPSVAAAADGNSSTGWPFDVATQRIQYIYDSSHFTTNGVNFPILISQIRYRANGSTSTTWTGSSGQLSMDLSTAPIDYAAITNTFANNHGANVQNVYNGPFTVDPGSTTAGTPGPFHVTVTFTTPFLYDPAQGDLVIDTTHSGLTIANTPTLDLVSTTGVALARRVQTTTVGNATGTVWTGEAANVLEFSYTPSNGLFAGFSATPTSGALPLQVQFSDTSFSSAPGGVTSWAWDFNGDNAVDSNLQNPTFTYTTCGDFTVSLTVNDGVNPASTLTRTAFVRAGDNPVPSFSYAVITGNAYQFTDTTTPAATSWAWDFNNDGITDSTAQNPIWVFPQACVGATVQLTVSRDCRGPFSTTRNFAIAPNAFTGIVSRGNGLSSTTFMGNIFDLQVTNPAGINICAFGMIPYTFTGPFHLDVYVTPDSYVGKHTVASAWRLIASGSGVSGGGTSATAPEVVASLNGFAYLPPGNYGMALYISIPGGGTANLAYSNGPQGPFSNSDLTLFPNPATAPGRSSSALFGASGVDSRVWNGTVYYSTATNGGDAGYGFFGAGCPSTLGITNLVPQSRPQFGQTLNVALNNLPASAALLLTGFSNTSGPLGPLPTDLAPFGAPGCSVRVSPDASVFLFGANNAATWSFSVPSQPSLLGLLLYNQALVLDAAANGLGAVMSDAAALMFGN